MRLFLITGFVFLAFLSLSQNIPEQSNKIRVKHLNLITKEEEILEFDKNEFEDRSASISSAFNGEIPNFDINGSLKSLDLIGTYTQASTLPETAVAFLLNDLNGLYYTASFINPKYLITAASDIYDARENLDRIYVTSFNYIRGAETRSITWATDIYFFTTQWQSDNDWENNIALVKVDRPIGIVGYLGYGYQNGNDFFEEKNFFLSFIEESTYKQKKYSAKPDIINDDYFLFQYKQFADGAPFYRDNGIIYGVDVFTRYANSTPIQNGVARINQEKFNTIKNMLTDDLPASADIMPLMVDVEPRVIDVAESLDDITFFIHNYSSETFNGEIKMNIHLSEDEIIDENDSIIETYTVNSNMPSLKTYRFQPSSKPVIPLTIKSGEYFVGVSINTDDYNTSNNYTAGFDCDTIRVRNTYGSNYISGNITAPNAENTDGYCVLFEYYNGKIEGIYDIVTVENDKYEFKNVLLGSYVIAYIPFNSDNTRLIPTFYDHTAYWDQSTSFVVIESDTVNDININAIQIAELSGNKYVSGNLNNSTEKAAGTTNADNFFSDVYVYLKTPDNESIINFCQPDEDGNYFLENLEEGTWKVDVNKPGFKLTASHSIDITNQTDTMKHINFEFLPDSTIKAKTITGISSIESDFDILVYPNPAKNYVDVSADFPTDEFTVELYNLKGKKIEIYYRTQERKTKLDISHLPKGTYIISVYAGNEIKKSQLLLKQ